MDIYSFPLRPEDHGPSGSCNFSRPGDIDWNKIYYNKNNFYFSEFSINQKEFKRTYTNDWNELREYIGFNDIELIDNELVLINLNYKLEFVKLFAQIMRF